MKPSSLLTALATVACTTQGAPASDGEGERSEAGQAALLRPVALTGDCREGAPMGELSAYARTVATVQQNDGGTVRVRTCAVFPAEDLRNVLGTIAAGQRIHVLGPIKHELFSAGIGYVVPLIDSAGVQCRGYISATVIDELESDADAPVDGLPLPDASAAWRGPCLLESDEPAPQPTPPATLSEAPLHLGHGEQGTFSVQVRALSTEELAQLQRLESSHGAGVIPAKTEGLPSRFSIGDPYRVATTRGVFDATLQGFELQNGGEGLLFFLHLESQPAGEGRALVSKPNGRKLTKLREASPDASAIATYLPAVKKAFTDAGHKGAPILAEHLKVVRGQYPAPHVALISVKLPNPDEEEEDYFSALLLGDSSGSISGAVHEPAQRWEAFEIDYLVDLEADGVDEVGFTSAYYEGTYELLLEWDGAQPQHSTLAGDGS